jgi:hypothetical protein
LRKKVIWLGIVVFLVIAAWTGAWVWAAGEVNGQLVALAQNDGDTEPQVTCTHLEVGGFPFWLDATCEGARLTWGDETVTAAGIKATTLFYNPTHANFSVRSPVTTENAFTGSASSLEFTGLEASAHLIPRDLFEGVTTGRGWRIERISVVADGLKWSDTVADPFLQASADHVEAHLVDLPARHDTATGAAGLAAYLAVGNLDAPGYKIARGSGSLTAELTGLPDDLQVLANDPDLLRHWQQRGGTLTIDELKGSQPEPATLFDVTGSAALTDTGLLNVDLSYTTRNIFQRFVGLLPSYQIPLLEGAAQADGTSKNSIRLADGRLKLLTFTILDVPPLF